MWGKREKGRLFLFRPRMAIIGSREQLCIHPEVSKKETNFEKVTDLHRHVHPLNPVYNSTSLAIAPSSIVQRSCWLSIMPMHLSTESRCSMPTVQSVVYVICRSTCVGLRSRATLVSTAETLTVCTTALNHTFPHCPHH